MSSHRDSTLEVFDADAIHAGNFGLRIDHEKVALETDALMARMLARMSLDQKINEIRGRQPHPIEGLYYAGGDEALGLAPRKMGMGKRSCVSVRSDEYLQLNRSTQHSH